MHHPISLAISHLQIFIDEALSPAELETMCADYDTPEDMVGVCLRLVCAASPIPICAACGSMMMPVSHVDAFVCHHSCTPLSHSLHAVVLWVGSCHALIHCLSHQSSFKFWLATLDCAGGAAGAQVWRPIHCCLDTLRQGLLRWQT